MSQRCNMLNVILTQVTVQECITLKINEVLSSGKIMI